MADRKTNLIWIDLEMTGLDTDRDTILELALIVTDSELRELAVGPVLAIEHPASVLEAMDEWNTRQHGGSGLTQRVRDSRVDAAAAERVIRDLWGMEARPFDRGDTASSSSRAWYVSGSYVELTTATSTAFESGSMTRHRNARRLQPSMIAAS